MSSDILLEEFEVLESIYPTELTKLSEKDVVIDAEPDDLVDGADPLRVTLRVSYPDGYPDTLPTLSLDSEEGTLADHEVSKLLSELNTVGEENLGMAMTFTLVSHLREQLSALVRSRAELHEKEEAEKERLALEAEEARTRGTPVTLESFKAWKAKFDAEQAKRKHREESDRLVGLSPKEREEWKRITARLSGRQLFEKNRNLEEETLMEEGTVSVDISQYDRTHRDEDEDEDERVTFSDSD
ncbi:RWD domain-containing protein [Hymenopellis radicata]|nr:RWD domain-containing protein [Hymenopellis radicata]